MTHTSTLSELLGHGLSQLDITVDDYLLIERTYTDVAYTLADYWEADAYDGLLYAQGSVPLGTVTRKYHRNDEIDIDLVVLRDLRKDQITQAELKADVGEGLEKYLSDGPDEDPELVEGKRCWTLQYERYHLDALPALPDSASRIGTGIILTDKSLVRWQHSDPKAYRDWFYGRMTEELAERRDVLAKRMEVESVPYPMIKTTLQQTVQALKRHRDIYFSDHLDDRPASIIITTLAALAYRGGGDLYEVLDDITDRMPYLVQRENELYVISNPVQAKENFADRWNSHPGRARMFFDWIERARRDFQAVAAGGGLNTVIKRLGEVLGPRVAQAAGAQAGAAIFDARRGGQLRYAVGTGALTTTGATATTRRVTRDHDFHGDTGARP
jgi:hypothetical protein